MNRDFEKGKKFGKVRHYRKKEIQLFLWRTTIRNVGVVTLLHWDQRNAENSRKLQFPY